VVRYTKHCRRLMWHGNLVDHGQASRLYQGLLAGHKLFYKRRVVVCGRWQGFVPKSQRPSLWLSIEAHQRLQAASLPSTTESAGPKCQSSLYTAAWTCCRTFFCSEPHSKVAVLGGCSENRLELTYLTKECVVPKIQRGPVKLTYKIKHHRVMCYDALKLNLGSVRVIQDSYSDLWW
jgi:hypothetical protein